MIADHIRSCAFLIADGVIPGNEGRGYVLRRIIRRAIRHGNKLGLPTPFFSQLVQPLITVMGDAYPELIPQAHIEKILSGRKSICPYFGTRFAFLARTNAQFGWG